MAATLTEYLASQEDLVREAALALPHQFSQCTYSLGPLRQAVYLCLTCPESKGLCSACSVACHTNHEQIELFPKRNFRCDCPTSAVAHACTLHTVLEDENTLNTYGRNFRGAFCRCERPYDPKTERETMIQCLACEDWFHESCCNLREQPPSRDPTPEVNPDTDEDQEDAQSDTSSTGLPRPLISAADYESFVCGECVSKIDTLKRWAGTRGVLLVARENTIDPWKCVNGYSLPQQEQDKDFLSIGSKRPLSPSAFELPDAKKSRGSSNPSSPSIVCLAPRPVPIAQKIYAAGVDASLGTGDVFLTEGFRQRWCRCNACLPSLEANPYLLKEEETYEPPDDPDSGLSLEELGMRALERIPRERAIDGIHAFNQMRDNLVTFLRPFAQEGKVVNEGDVKEFFASLKDTAKRI